MSANYNENHREILENANTILLVDWPGTEVPQALLTAGFKVFSYSPGKYSIAILKTGEKEGLTFKELDKRPEKVDIVNIFRPEEEHDAIIAEHVLPLKAKVIWLHPPVTSAKTAEIAGKHDLIFIEGDDIAAIAKAISSIV